MAVVMCMFSTAAAGCGVLGEYAVACEHSGACLNDAHLFSGATSVCVIILAHCYIMTTGE